MSALLPLLALLVLLITFTFLVNKKSGLVAVRSSIDGRYYLVRPQRGAEAADVMAGVRKALNDLIKGMNSNNEYKDILQKKIQGLLLTENPATTPDPTMTSYTVNKGERIVMCIRSPDTGEFYDMNTIMYVAIHELAHVACPEFGHTKLFAKIFAMLLKNATRLGIYNDQNYLVSPMPYCGITIRERVI